jgi:hypothetical protein
MYEFINPEEPAKFRGLFLYRWLRELTTNNRPPTNDDRRPTTDHGQPTTDLS